MLLSELIPFLKEQKIKPKKGLSQNFLIDPNIVKKMVAIADVRDGEVVMEIGPGPGILTKGLLGTGARVYAVEIDGFWAKELERLQNGRLRVIQSDILKFQMEELPGDIKVIGNLPYHITTPILEKLFFRPFKSITVMVQKEVGQRMMAKVGSKDFGSLSLFVQYHTQIMGSFLVPPGCFYPKPKVDSMVLCLEKKENPCANEEFLFGFIRKAFQKRRKMICNTLGKERSEVVRALKNIGMREDARPENVSLEQWILLSSNLK